MQVSTPGLQAAHHYIWKFTQQLQQQAAGSGVLVQTTFENYTGSFDFDFVGERFVNGEGRFSLSTGCALLLSVLLVIDGGAQLAGKTQLLPCVARVGLLPFNVPC
jgi:hypothetical protein